MTSTLTRTHVKLANIKLGSLAHRGGGRCSCTQRSAGWVCLFRISITARQRLWSGLCSSLLQPVPPCVSLEESVQVYKEHCRMAREFHQVKHEISALEDHKWVPVNNGGKRRGAAGAMSSGNAPVLWSMPRWNISRCHLTRRCTLMLPSEMFSTLLSDRYTEAWGLHSAPDKWS